MGFSPSLAAYLAWARRGSQSDYKIESERPQGELVWGHATSTSRADALCQLAERLRVHRPGINLLLTATEDVTRLASSRGPVILQPLPEDRFGPCEAFLSHWAPDICLWTGGDFRPTLLTCARRHRVPLHLIDADVTLLSGQRWHRLCDPNRSLIRHFSGIMARSEEAVRQLRRIGVKEADITPGGLFQAGSVSLPCNEEDRAAVSASMRGRPIWMAAAVQPDELEIVLGAHRRVTRFAHRLLLVIAPARSGDVGAFRERIAAEGWRPTVWSEGQMPAETTQIVLADTPEEMGLWYRLVSVTLMASSLVPGHGGRDPNEPAAHGSAILYGPNSGRYLEIYDRFAQAGAARAVQDSETLASAVEDLIAPDRSAAMAHAAWDLASQGAEVTDRIMDLVQDTLDVLKAP